MDTKAKYTLVDDYFCRDGLAFAKMAGSTITVPPVVDELIRDANAGAQAAQLAAENETLAKALEAVLDTASHPMYCAINWVNARCDCGLDDAFAALASHRAQKGETA